MLKIERFYSLKELYRKEKTYYKGGGVSTFVGDLTGGLIGDSHAEKAQRRAMEEQAEQARRQAELYQKQMEEENKRRIEEAKRAAEEAKRAREAQEKAIREAEEKRKAEADFTRQVAQDSQTLDKTAINQQQTFNKASTTIDYSNTQDKTFKNDDEDKDKDKLRKAFKYRL
ncbi:hypothetical protein IX317_000364 [Fusobacterium sp. DD29]|uniref:cell envelope integrity protein TolA n=1 Tax=unclassified Fusobacterium TaxID=2648384 RepID=UPI001B8BC416|nr:MULTISPECIES: cell envelope integrity protein TolA [unclassified Fusobacterium]MBR8748705.1 hypothetical protein [Fusobacterium sp. DD29]MBR8760943.1 hypothetical protein [Fusobacterium sp. DD25]MBR8766984.1 hypothetical protein [Fusobacterium sp. DD43]MBR8770985.1 hypothetical protein [Fusobacterium sp. DD40]MBR8775260.1 hypothetical protein [Fusobacterium sp. DD17]